MKISIFIHFFCTFRNEHFHSIFGCMRTYAPYILNSLWPLCTVLSSRYFFLHIVFYRLYSGMIYFSDLEIYVEGGGHSVYLFLDMIMQMLYGNVKIKYFKRILSSRLLNFKKVVYVHIYYSHRRSSQTKYKSKWQHTT